MINLLIVLLSIPHIINPGPNNFVNELNVVFKNVQGFVDLRAKSASATLLKQEQFCW